MTVPIQPIWQGYIELGASAEKYGHKDIAQSMFDAALEEIKRLSVDDPETARKMRSLGDAALLAGRTEQALLHYKHSLAIYNYALNKNDFETAETKTLIAELYCVQNKKKLAVLWYKHALSTASRSKNQDTSKLRKWKERTIELMHSTGKNLEADSLTASI